MQASFGASRSNTFFIYRKSRGGPAAPEDTALRSFSSQPDPMPQSFMHIWTHSRSPNTRLDTYSPDTYTS
jgi:hypothetical protein